ANNRRLPKVADWGPLMIDRQKLTLAWADLSGPGVILEPQGAPNGKPSSFLGTDSRLRENGKPLPEVDRWLTVNVAGKPHKVVFGSLANRMMDLRTTTDWVIRPRLLKIPGIAQVFVMGEGRKQYQVLVSRQKLQQFN